jgi:7-cyano-7-deazaguanine synthase in queuosine biosynthesis
LHEALGFLTGDFWRVEFVQRRSAAPAPPQNYLNLPVPTKAVLAYSDGMDSRAVAGLLGAVLGEELIRVRVGSKSWDRANGSTEPFTAVPYDVPCNMPNREASSRSRGFKFALISGIAAYLTGAKEIVIPESGQGAIGPALITAGHAYPDYRNHPLFTMRMGRFLKALLGHDAHFVFPRIWSTKGETLREFVSLPGGGNWASTRSCWRNNQWSSVNGKLRQCGVCAACMLRRVSVHSAGLTEAADVYVCTDMSAPTLEKAIDPAFTRRSGVFREYAIAGVLHMDHLAEMASPDAARLVKRHALFLGPALGLEPEVAGERLTALLKRHAEEWSSYMDSVRADSFIRQWARYTA